MKKNRSQKKDWGLTQEGFNLLLSRLDPDPELAAQKYEQIRKGLLVYFTYRGSLLAEEHVDETFNRVARNLSDGKRIFIDDPAGYFYGVAYNVLMQHYRDKDRFLPLDNMPDVLVDWKTPHELWEQDQERADQEMMIDCLEKCLGGLPDKHREIITQYYDGEKSVKIKNRKVMAERLMISVDLLRLRAMRARDKLEVCVEQCIESDQGDAME